jgi:hypothetical protein
MSSIVIFPTQSHPEDSTSIVVTGDKYKGDGFYSRSDGLHTMQYKTTGFVGTIGIEATLETTPTADDWFGVLLYSSNISNSFSIDTTGKVSNSIETYQKTYAIPTNTVEVFNFTGNYVWVRAKITNWTDGTVNVIRLNH